MTNRQSDSPEVGSVVLFEHVNLRVPDHRLATLYFIEGLGFTRDPLRMVGTRNMWINVGQQQFHLPIGEPAALDGEVGVVVPDLTSVERQLEAVAVGLRNTAFSYERINDVLLTTTPWGHRIRLHAHGDLPGRLPQALAYMELCVPPGTAESISIFYGDVLECPVESRPIDGDPAVHVTVGSFQTFRFRERPGARAIRTTSHVAVYLTRYRRIYARLQHLGAILEPDADEQFRFCDITDPETGRVIYSLEHEMRSLHHPDYRRPLVNRLPVPYRVD